MKKTVFIVLTVLLVSCGYHFRGQVNLPAEMKKVYVRNGSSALVSGFSDVFRYASGSLARSQADAGIIVNVLNERMKRRAISLTGTGKANEFELHYVLDYQLLDGHGKMLVPTQTIDLYRNYFNQQQQVIGKANEERVIREEMYRQAVQTIIRKAQVAFK